MYYSRRFIWILAGLLVLVACEQDNAPATSASGQVAVTSPEINRPETLTVPSIITNNKAPDKQFNIGNTHYLFVVAEHTVDELEELLQRADDIAQTSLDPFDQLDIALVIHGDNIEMFTQKNYQKNKKLIDLAAKLDAFNVIDLKICETSMTQRGISREDIPSFIESVPFAPDEIERLTSDGYINL